MTRMTRIITVAGVALVLVPSAFAQAERFQEAPQWHQALQARSEGMNKKYGLGEYGVNSIEAREESQTAKYGAQLAATPTPDWFERAANAAIRDNRGVVVVDDRFDLHPKDISQTVTATSSGREVDFTKIGIGIALGLMLVLGLYFAIRGPRLGRPLAH